MIGADHSDTLSFEVRYFSKPGNDLNNSWYYGHGLSLTRQGHTLVDWPDEAGRIQPLAVRQQTNAFQDTRYLLSVGAAAA